MEKQLGNGVADLAQNHADILDSPNLQDSLLKFRQAYEDSVARLEKPNFVIATIVVFIRIIPDAIALEP